MDENLLNRQNLYELKTLDNKSAVNFVEICEKATIEELKDILSSYIKHIENAIKTTTFNILRDFTNIVYKGFRLKSEHAGAIKYFYLGYYTRYQEEILDEAQRYAVQTKITQIASKKHFKNIMQYLYINGITRQKDLVTALKVDKSNLSRFLNEMTRQKLVTKISEPKNVFYELTQEGYAYCRNNELCTNPSTINLLSYPNIRSRENNSTKIKMLFCEETAIKSLQNIYYQELKTNEDAPMKYYNLETEQFKKKNSKELNTPYKSLSNKELLRTYRS